MEQELQFVNEVVLAVKDQDQVVDLFEDLFGLQFNESWEVPIDKMKVRCARVGETELHVMASTSPDGLIAKFVDEKGESVHHIAFRVKDLDQIVTRLRQKGVRLIPDVPRLGRITEAGQSRYIFVHPKSAHGFLIELIEKVVPK